MNIHIPVQSSLLFSCQNKMLLGNLSRYTNISMLYAEALVRWYMDFLSFRNNWISTRNAERLSPIKLPGSLKPPSQLSRAEIFLNELIRQLFGVRLCMLWRIMPIFEAVNYCWLFCFLIVNLRQEMALRTRCKWNEIIFMLSRFHDFDRNQKKCFKNDRSAEHYDLVETTFWFR